MSTACTMDSIRTIVARHKSTPPEDVLKEIEDTIAAFSKMLADEQNIEGLEMLLVETRPLYEVIGKAKAAKLIRSMVEQCLRVDQEHDKKVTLVRDCISWALQNNRVFLKRTLEARLIKLHNDNGNYVEAMKMAGPLESELKKLDDRELLMEVTLEESKSAYFLKNYLKSKAALVIARTSAAGAYVSTHMQASLDLQSGILYSSDEKDFKTGYSYCYEALEGFLQCDDKAMAIRALKYMCLCKIMNNEAEQVAILLATKMMLPVKGRAIDAMRELASAFKERSHKKLQQCLDRYPSELLDDVIISSHSNQLHGDMLEKEIARVIEPYSVVDLEYIEKKVGLPKAKVEKALATMLLDKKIFGCIDQHSGNVHVYPKPMIDKNYQKATEVIKALSKAVDATWQRSGKLLN